MLVSMFLRAWDPNDAKKGPCPIGDADALDFGRVSGSSSPIASLPADAGNGRVGTLADDEECVSFGVTLCPYHGCHRSMSSTRTVATMRITARNRTAPFDRAVSRGRSPKIQPSA